MYQEIDELLSGFGVIKDFGVEDRFQRKLEDAAIHLDYESLRTSYLAAGMGPLTRTLVQFGVLAIVIHAVVMVYNGQITFGEFAAASFLSRKFLLPFTFLGSVVDLCGKGTNALGNVAQSIYMDCPQPSTFISVGETRVESVRFDAVSYAYRDRKIFDGLHAEFRPGVINVVKGPTGVGKTTLLRLIMGDLQPDAGQISYGSMPSTSQLKRQHLALVTQFPKLFTASLQDNITLFDPEVDTELLAKAMDVSLTAGFAAELPCGVDTVVGPNGLRLSGGQMQSVAIARAFYSNAKILLFDEPTASFDLEREQLFLKKLQSSLAGRLVILTSHRPQPIQAAGYLVELGVMEGRTKPTTMSLNA
jgi:ATP-binding cassette subfamily C protein LapB